MVAPSAAQPSENAYLRVPVQPTTAGKRVPQVIDGTSRSTSCDGVELPVAVDALEEIHAAVLKGDVGPPQGEWSGQAEWCASRD